MYLRKLTLLNFKNIARGELAFGPGINCLVGDNGAGKTNLVDAVHYLSMCKSAFGMTDGQSIRHGEEFFLLEGHYTTDRAKSERVVCSFSRRSGKLLKRNDKEYERLADHVGLIPAVVVSPADSVLISDAAEERRRFLNAFLSTLDRSYLASLMRYNAVLGERNRLLKMQPDETVLSIYDRQLVEHGEAIHARRRELVARLQSFETLLRNARQKDFANEFTTSGIHRDDLVLRIGGYPLRKYGSQGQQKSFLIALKLAQYAVLAEERNERPLLLLDDLFDKLDAGRVEQLLRLVAGDRFGQILITDCNPTRLRAILDRAGHPYRLYHVADGAALDPQADDPQADEAANERSADEAENDAAGADVQTRSIDAFDVGTSNNDTADIDAAERKATEHHAAAESTGRAGTTDPREA